MRPKCGHCDKPAACVGAYEGHEELGFACDECCAHGNEDGFCVQLCRYTGVAPCTSMDECERSPAAPGPARAPDWRQYQSTLALALLMQREAVRILDAAHVGDADTAIAAGSELREMIGAMLLDFGVHERDELGPWCLTPRDKDNDLMIASEKQPLVFVRGRSTTSNGDEWDRAERLARHLHAFLNGDTAAELERLAAERDEAIRERDDAAQVVGELARNPDPVVRLSLAAALGRSA